MVKYILFIPFACEGAEENAFTEKDIVKWYVWWGKRGELEIENGNAKTL